MPSVKEVKILEEASFETIQALHNSINFKNLEEFRLGLKVLDQLNFEYYEITGQYYIPLTKILDYHSKQWSVF